MDSHIYPSVYCSGSQPFSTPVSTTIFKYLWLFQLFLISWMSIKGKDFKNVYFYSQFQPNTDFRACIFIYIKCTKTPWSFYLINLQVFILELKQKYLFIFVVVLSYFNSCFVLKSSWGPGGPGLLVENHWSSYFLFVCLFVFIFQ